MFIRTSSKKGLLAGRSSGSRPAPGKSGPKTISGAKVWSAGYRVRSCRNFSLNLRRRLRPRHLRRLGLYRLPRRRQRHLYRLPRRSLRRGLRLHRLYSLRLHRLYSLRLRRPRQHRRPEPYLYRRYAPTGRRLPRRRQRHPHQRPKQRLPRELGLLLLRRLPLRAQPPAPFLPRLPAKRAGVAL